MHYFVLQSLHKERPSTTLYYKACTQHSPNLIKVWHTASFSTQQAFTHSKLLLHKERVNTQQAFKQKSFYTQKAFTHRMLFAQQAFAQRRFLHRENFLVHSENSNCSSKTGSRCQSEKKDFETLFKRNFKRKISSTKMGKICSQTIIAALMQPPQYDLRCPAAKDTSITHAAAAPSNFDAAITLRYRDIELHHIELYAQPREIIATF